MLRIKTIEMAKRLCTYLDELNIKCESAGDEIASLLARQVRRTDHDLSELFDNLLTALSMQVHAAESHVHRPHPLHLRFLKQVQIILSFIPTLLQFCKEM